MHPSRRLPAALLLAVGFAWPAPAPGQDDPAPHATAMRVETDLYGDSETPAARSLTIFHGGVAWDFLELPKPGAAADSGDTVLDQIVLHDPRRERVVVIDPSRNVKTTIDTIRLERLSVSLAKWARGADDRLIRWAGGPDFGSGLTEEGETLDLVGPRVHYRVRCTPAPSPEAAEAYRRFADTAILLRALMHPGGIPPFPRLALNRRIEAATSIPTEVTLEIDPKLSVVSVRAPRMRSVHRLHPRLLAGDFKRLEEAEAAVAAAESLELAAFVDPSTTDVAARSGDR